jgi:leucyl aminopeptidase
MPDCLLPSTTSEPSVPIRAVAVADLDRFVASLDKAAAAWVDANEFKAAAGSVLLVPAANGALDSVLLGLGDPASEPGSALVPGALASRLPSGIYRLDSGLKDPAGATLAFALGAYRYTRYRSGGAVPRLIVPQDVDADTVAAVADGVWLARDLINTAPNDMGPAEFASAARNLAARHGADCSETVGGALLSANLPADPCGRRRRRPRPRAAPGRSRLGRRGDPKVTLVGKGVCFDTGGLDIKPSAACF